MNEHELNELNGQLKKKSNSDDQYYFGHGKLLLSGEYFVLEGAQALALPTKVGQSLSVKYTPSFSPTLSWKSFDVDNKLWFESSFEFWHFNPINPNDEVPAKFLQKVLQQVRKQNIHFLRDDQDVKVETRLGFPLEWGLGSSSSLIYNIAQWAYISPFELLFKTYGGSGYDIACAQSEGPILYRKNSQGPNWSPVTFDPTFKDQLFFVYLGNKQDSRQAIKEFNKKKPFSNEVIAEVSHITQEFLTAQDLKSFMFAIKKHEDLVSSLLAMPKVKEERFADFQGEVKSLGAWGGDFVLVASEMSKSEVRDYFKHKGLEVFLEYNDLIQSPHLNEINPDSVFSSLTSSMLQ